MAGGFERILEEAVSHVRGIVAATTRDFSGPLTQHPSMHEAELGHSFEHS